MGLLDGKNALIFGLANDKSIAWGITQAFHREGAAIGISYAGEMLKRRVTPLAEQVGCQWLEECDVTSDEQIAAAAEKAAAHFGKIDVLVHSVAFAGRDELTGPYYNTSREGFKNAMDISVFSFVALAKAFQPILNPGASLICMTYYGSVKVAPHYNVMGVAKAALESSTRYLAYDFGPQKVRVNAISAGPIRTLAAAGVGGFRDMYKHFADMSPMRENVTIEDVGNAAVFLASDLSAKITGDVLYVDSGFNIVGVQMGAKEASDQ
ncbi:MAG: enoyl-ACP reductase [Anaerolineae bacterium CFX3]|jgi:enoyl-[acyl-carrier protein] reductase I|nr:Enoyl-[acyl-carrier-protein] reductase [NADH] FabI [Anaerolineales bacterium]MCE7905829.1 enoyl-ACP reductase [Anaerolineae bacterium CFX3]MCQ3946991.1 NADH-specific enoyl-ACP reductase [Anaerolineae bacterium]OQY85884.1 MAG: enoyl-ACP reductase [Anaerolineae bacterium UTCFX3]GER79528.1 enoyl-ACP reductase [Candidatus Denitrolinea symbiosum]